MFSCPECANELADSSRECPACGKKFLSAFAREQRNVRQQNVDVPDTDGDALTEKGHVQGPSTSEDAHSEGSQRVGAPKWRPNANVAITVVVLISLAGYVSKALTKTLTKTSAIAGAAPGKPVAKPEDLPQAGSLTVRDIQLLPSPTKLEARGEVTNRSDRVLFEATLLTYVTAPGGGVVGPAKGVVRLLKPGQSAPFRTAGLFNLNAATLARTSWKTEIGSVSFAPAK